MQLHNILINKVYTAEIVPVNSAVGQQFSFPDFPFLRNKLIYGIAASLSGVGVTSGKTNLNNATSIALYPSFVTLADSSGIQFIQNMPLAEMIDIGYRDSTALVAAQNYLYNTNGTVVFNPRNVVWTKSFIYYPTAPAVANACIQFNIFYK